MTHYLVRWSIVETPDHPITAREAAQRVRANYFTVRSGADRFTVIDIDDPLQSRAEYVDLTDSANDGVSFELSPQMLHRMAKVMLDEGADAEQIVAMLEKPHNWPELVTQVITDVEYDKVSPVPERPDYSS